MRPADQKETKLGEFKKMALPEKVYDIAPASKKNGGRFREVKQYAIIGTRRAFNGECSLFYTMLLHAVHATGHKQQIVDT